MNSKHVACGLAFLVNIANTLCFILLFETRGLRLSNLDGGRNNGNHYFCSAKSIEIRIQHIASSGNRKIKLLARTRMRSASVLHLCFKGGSNFDYFRRRFRCEMLYAKIDRPPQATKSLIILKRNASAT